MCGNPLLQNYLALRGIGAEIGPAQHRAPDQINSARASDLLVLDEYGSKSMREWFLGGVAHEFLDANSSMAVLMAH